MSENRYLLTGGGTGGHVYPAIAIADELRRREEGAAFLYVGVKGKAEEKIVPARGYPLEFVTSRGWPGARPSLGLVRFVLSLGWGILKAIRILRRFQPTVIIATGGYVSAPIMLAWVLLRRLKMTEAKAFVHEQNMSLGRLNKLVGNLADRVGVSFDESRRFLPKAEWVGYPVRQEVGQFTREEARQKLGIPADAKVVLAFGGSQGARTINRAMIDALPGLLEDEKVWVLHGVGRYRGADYQAEEDTQARFASLSLSSAQQTRYRMEAYLDPIQVYYAAADVSVCRAGAGTLAEIAICGLPAITIPKANLPGDHQVMNARALGDKGAAVVLYERVQQHPQDGLIEMVEGNELVHAVQRCLADLPTLAKMREAIKPFADLDALGRIAERIQQLAADALPPLPEQKPLEHEGPELSAMTGGQIVSYLSRHGRESLSEKDLEYLAYRTDGYLASKGWQTRNVGVKLVGLLGLTRHLGLILYILQDKTPAPGWHRLLGGDFVQVGFIRRNAMLVLRQLDIWNDDVCNALRVGLQDPYYEVRSWCAQTVVHFAKQGHAAPDMLESLTELTRERNFEVARAGLFALAELDERKDTYTYLKTFFLHPNWRIREAVAHCLMRMVQRGVLEPSRIKDDIDQLLLTSTGFVPRFQIREKMLSLYQTLQETPNDTEANTGSPS